jgi:hypothetical protein
MTQADLASATAYSPATIAAIETCRLIASKEFAQAADKVFGADGHLTRLQQLVEQTSVLPWFRDLVEVEQRAVDIREYEPHLMPGLLQTESYMRAVVRAGRPVLSPDDIERAVALRMTRQQILAQEDEPPLDREHGPQLWVIMDESVLHRTVGDPEIMREQRDHLASMAARPNITIQVMPYSRGATCAFGRAFTILVSKSDPVIYLEDVTSARYIRDRDEVGKYMVTFDHLRATALDEDESVNLIKDGNR